MMPVAIATMTLISCNKEVNSAEPATGETLRINVTAVADDLLGLDGTRTYIGTYNDTPNTIIWGENESMKIAALGDGDADKATYGYSTTSEYAGEAEATFGFEITPAEGKTGNTYTYVGLYPASASVDNSSITAHKVELKSTQDATADSYDPKSYILIAMHEDGKTTSNADWTASYRRATALNKITLKGLAEDIVSVKITLPENAKFAGRRTFNLLTDEFGEVYSASNTIEVSFATPLTGTNVDGVNNKVVWFNSWGVSLAEGEEMTIVAKSATKSYTKTIAARSGGISFKQGYLNTLGVNMSGISGEEMAYDGCYAELLYEDVSNQLSNSYGLAEITKNHGDNWKMYAVAVNGAAIGVRRNDKPSSGTQQNDSFIKLPDFVESINKVVVTLKSVTAGKTLTLEDSATATDGTIASLTTTEATVYTFQLTNPVNTAYFRSTGAQAQVEKIQVFAGEDDRIALEKPKNLVAVLNEDDPSITNSINVSWDAVIGAGAYLITLVPDTGDDVFAETTSTSHTFTGLQYETGYLVSVQAIPQDSYINNVSDEAVTEQVVTTGSEPTGGVYFERISDLASVTTGEYVIAAYAKSKFYAMSNSFAGKIDGTEINVVNDKISETDAEGFIVTLTVNGDGKVSIYNGRNYLNCQTTGTDFAVGTTATYHTLAKATYGTFRISNTRAIAFNGTKFGNYAVSNINGTSYWDIELFKKADPRTSVTLAFEEDAFEFVVNSDAYKAFTPQVATATPNASVISNAITYALNDPQGVATGFSTSTGVFTLTGNVGTATITASYAGDDNYKPAANVSYTVKVTPNSAYVTFTPDDFEGQGVSGGNVTDGSPISVTKSGITVSCSNGFGATSEIRCYQGSEFKISAEKGKTITVISFTFSGNKTGGLNEVYSGLSTSSWIVESLASQARFSEIVVSYN